MPTEIPWPLLIWTLAVWTVGLLMGAGIAVYVFGKIIVNLKKRHNATVATYKRRLFELGREAWKADRARGRVVHRVSRN